MAVQSSFYVPDGSTRTFPSTKHIATKQHVGVYLQRALDSVWETALSTSYELVNNSIVFDSAVDNILYLQIEIRVVDTTAELIDSPSNIALVAASIADVNTVADSILDVNTVADNIGSVQNISAVIVPNIAEILLADDNATTATTQAGIAITQATNASSSATQAQLYEWEAEAERLTADSYVTEAEDTFVNLVTSDGDGTFTYTPTTDYSALHYKNKAQASATTVADKLHTVSTIADMLLLEHLIYPNVNILGYTTANDGGGGLFNYDATIDKSTANAGTIIDPSVSLALQGTGVGLGCWVRQYSGAVNVKWFGAVGTADDTSVFQAAFNSGFNVQIPDGAYNVGNLTLDTENQTIFSNRVIFNALNNTDYVLTVNAKYVVIGNLDFFFSNSISVTTYRGLNILNSFFAVNKIRFTCVNKGAGTSGTYNAVNIGDGTTQLQQIKIGYLGTYGFDYPYYINYVDNLQIDYLKCEFYRRGTYLKDCTNIDIETLWAGSISTNAVGSAGENALLIEATKANDSASGINIDNIVVKGSGEHGVRLGGQYTINGFFCNSMYIKDTGSGVGTGIDPNNHGGCGFKVLGPTTLAENIKHKNIVVANITVENVVNKTNPDRLNFAGIQLGKCEYVQIDNIQVIPTKVNGVISTFSARSGIEIVGCNDVLIGEVKVVNPKYAGLYLYSGPAYVPVTYEYYWGANKNIKISNVSITDSDDAIVLSHELDDTANMENISIENVDILTANRALYTYEVSGGYKGTFTNCHVSFKADTIASDLVKAPSTGIVIDAVVKNATIPMSRVGDNGTKILDLDKNLTYAIGDANVTRFAQQAKTMQFYIHDDMAVSFDTFAFPHFISVAGGGANEYAQMWVRPTSSPSNTGLHVGSSVERANTVLTGTTGTDGKLTIGIQKGKIYIENRLGLSSTITVSDMV